jgi:hypothetical protein
MPTAARAATEPTEAMVSYVTTHKGLSEAAAKELVATQGKAGDIVGEMQHALGSTFGGVWFDDATGRYMVGVAGGTPSGSVLAGASPNNVIATPASAQPYVESHAGESEFVAVRYSEAELEAAKQRLDKKLVTQIDQGFITTGINAEKDAVVIHLANTALAETIAQVENDANNAGVAATVSLVPQTAIEATPAACYNHAFGTDPEVMFCDRSLRGGVTIFSKFTFPHSVCSLGFIVHNSKGEYIMTAGHCISEGNAAWLSAFSNFSENNQSTWAVIGEEEAGAMGENGDFGWIKVSTSLSPWFPISDPSSVASLDPYGPWGDNQEWFLENITWSALGDINCHTGGSSDTQCGEVLETDATIPLEGKAVGKMTRDSFCSIAGDSGGTVWGNHSGMGMDDAINVPCGDSGAESWYTEAIRDAYYMGLEFYVPPYGAL